MAAMRRTGAFDRVGRPLLLERAFVLVIGALDVGAKEFAPTIYRTFG
jgi:hypothetical protein